VALGWCRVLFIGYLRVLKGNRLAHNGGPALYTKTKLIIEAALEGPPHLFYWNMEWTVGSRRMKAGLRSFLEDPDNKEFDHDPQSRHRGVGKIEGPVTLGENSTAHHPSEDWAGRPGLLHSEAWTWRNGILLESPPSLVTRIAPVLSRFVVAR